MHTGFARCQDENVSHRRVGKVGPIPPHDIEVDRVETLRRLAAEEIERIRTTHGNGAIFGGSYGWSSAGRFPTRLSRMIFPSSIWKIPFSASCASK